MRLRAATNDTILSAYGILACRHPMSLRGLHYQFVSRGFYENTVANYKRLSRCMTKARERGTIPWDWIVDNLRQTLQPPSWAGLEEYGECIKKYYRKDYWAQLDFYPEIFCEKDAMAACLQPVTREYDVPLNVIRGYCSSSFAHTIAWQWQRIGKSKPIFAFYLGDFDPSGMDLERNLREKIARYSGLDDANETESDSVEPGQFYWQRLAVNASDFDELDIMPLVAKRTDARTRRFEQRHGHQCAELDAIDPEILRKRIEHELVSHIDSDEWERLQRVEEAERESIDKFVLQLSGDSDAA